MMFLENDVLGTYIHGEEFAKVTEIRFLEKEQKWTYGLGLFQRMKGIFRLRLVFVNYVSFFFLQDIHGPINY
jgi:hypothetical protein